MAQMKRRFVELRHEQHDYKFRLEDLRRDELMGQSIVQERLQEVMKHLEEIQRTNDRYRKTCWCSGGRKSGGREDRN